jgi:hypothetical protein
MWTSESASDKRAMDKMKSFFQRRDRVPFALLPIVSIPGPKFDANGNVLGAYEEEEEADETGEDEEAPNKPVEVTSPMSYLLKLVQGDKELATRLCVHHGTPAQAISVLLYDRSMSQAEISSIVNALK